MSTKRRLKTKYKIIILFLPLCILGLLWSRYISTSGLVIKEYKVVNKKLPTSFNGLKIVHFTDTHYGRTTNNNDFKYLVSEINELKPDIVFFTGDLIDKDTVMNNKKKKELIKHLNNLDAKIGKYAISGNHDLQFDEYDEIIEKSGFLNLTNSFDIIYSKENDSIYIAGLESEIIGSPDIKSIMQPIETGEKEDVPGYKILLLHTPDTISKIKHNTFDLTLAGHSHNGQVRIPFIGAVTKPNGAKKYYNEYYKVGKTDLYISSGIGTSTLNFRLFNKPSFNFYRLVNK